MFTTTHERNADLNNAKLQRQALKQLSPRRLRKAAAGIASQADLDGHQRTLLAWAQVAAKHPVLDAPRLRSGGLTLAWGGGLAALAVLFGLWLLIGSDGSDAGPIQVASELAAAGLLVLGFALLGIGWSMRSGAHLPISVSPSDIEQAQLLLDTTAESSRAPAPAHARQIVTALMMLDAAVLLYFAAPVLMPDAVPMVQILVVAAASFLVARICLESISAVAHSARVGQVKKLHALKMREGTPQATACAAAIRNAFDGIVGGHWPARPGWEVFAPAMLWALPLVAIQGLLLSVRFIAGDTADIIAALAIAGALAALTTVFAVRTAIQAEALSPEIGRAKRLLARFPTPAQLAGVLDADAAMISERLSSAQVALAEAVQSRPYGGAVLSVAPMTLGAVQVQSAWVPQPTGAGGAA